MSGKSNTEEFIKKAKLKHGDKYDYSKVEYVNAITKIIIICKTHGDFLQTPNSHLSGSGCIKCAGIHQYTTEEWIKKANELHNNKYDYSKVKYKNANTKVIIICKTHGDFLQNAHSHLTKNGCRNCAFLDIGYSKKSNTNEFIQKSIKIHGDKYDYSNVIYGVNCYSKVIIICKIHGEFLQAPTDHLSGSGCSKCKIINIANSKRSNTEEFKEKAKVIHEEIYDYSKVEYVNNTSNIIIICKTHGEFLQQPSNHLMGKGCSKCVGKNKTTNDFIEESIKIHGEKYDYSKTKYIKCDANTIIICKIHGEFLQTPRSHLNGCGCQTCGKFESFKYCYKNSNTEEFIEKATKIHGEKYDYSKVDYTTGKLKVIIICKIHGDFLQTPNSHLSGSGCIKCILIKNGLLTSLRFRSNTEEFIEKATKIHGEKYDYSKVDYTTVKFKVIIICKIHGDFLQTPPCHLSGAGCPFCVNKTEGKLYEILQKQYPSLITQFQPIWVGKKRFDFCIPEHNIIIELDGRQHFEQVGRWTSPEKHQENDKEKEELATEHNYRVIRLLQEDVFYDTYDWFGELLENIKILINEKPTIQNIYMDKNDEYECFL
jgi:very-short-patch-repair endonuclease